jgi:hypothetical protein
MKPILTTLILFIFHFGFSQQYDTVFIEETDIDENNKIYTPGNVFIYDYEIIIDNQAYKLNTNKGMAARRDFELVAIDADSIGVDKIHLIVRPVEEAERTNKNQTQISFLQEPIYDSMSSTGVVENEVNVWIHPIRTGFFNALQTAPFPFVKHPLTIGATWTDEMIIGQAWGGELWGEWKGQLLQSYVYKLTAKETLQTPMGEVECYVIESTATSSMGKTSLKSYFSETYGFVRMEYRLFNNLIINMWMIDTKTGKEFNDMQTLFQTKQYIKQ